MHLNFGSNSADNINPRWELNSHVWKIVGDIKYQTYEMNLDIVKKYQADTLNLTEDEEALYAAAIAYRSWSSGCKLHPRLYKFHSIISE